MNRTYLQSFYIILSLLSAEIIFTKATTTSSQGCKKKAAVPYVKQLKSLKIDPQLKQQGLHDWAYIYAGFLAKSATTKQNSKEWLDLKKQSYISNDFCKYSAFGQATEKIKNFDICLDPPTPNETANVSACHMNMQNAYAALTTNYLDKLHTYLSSDRFPAIKGDMNGYKHNYATHHLSRAVGRLSQTNKITVDSFEPKLQFEGDARDLGIIVNISNHTDTSFAIAQSNHTDTFIGTVHYGNNGVNLHTASLQNGQSQGDKKVLMDHLTFYPMDPLKNKPILSDPVFTIRMYTGAQVKAFLQTLPHDRDNNTFQMNGKPTSPQHIAHDDDWYMLIVQNPTPQGQQKPNHDQRIQAINISTLKGPFLLNMQINETVHSKVDPHTQAVTTTKMFQPSFSSVQVIQPSVQDKQALPLFTLPQYLWTNPIVNFYWMMISTSYIGAITDFSFFGHDTFGSAFECYKGLGYFEVNHEHRFVIDEYNTLKAGQIPVDASWLVGCTMYETELKHCNDIPSVHVSQNQKNNIVVNHGDIAYVNFAVALKAKSAAHQTKDMFQKHGFNSAYSLPYHQLWSMIFSLDNLDLQEKTFFGELTQSKQNLYKLTWFSKDNKMLDSQALYLDFDIKDLEVSFLTSADNYKGDVANQTFVPRKVGETKKFKVTYKPEHNQYNLDITNTSPIDRVNIIHTMHIATYPITDLSYDVFHTYNVNPYTRCHILDGVLPKFLQDLTEDDWKSGIYLIPSVEHNEKLSDKHPGALTVTCYKSDKTTLLGSIAKQGQVKDSSKVGIRHPVKGYNLYSNQFNQPIYNVFMTTGILSKYVS